MADDPVDLGIEDSASTADADLLAAVLDPDSAYESELDEQGIGTNRRAAPPDGEDQDWAELHPAFAAELTKDGDDDASA